MTLAFPFVFGVVCKIANIVRVLVHALVSPFVDVFVVGLFFVAVFVVGLSRAASDDL